VNLKLIAAEGGGHDVNLEVHVWSTSLGISFVDRGVNRRDGHDADLEVHVGSTGLGISEVKVAANRSGWA
jgi:hypothetical protein